MLARESFLLALVCLGAVLSPSNAQAGDTAVAAAVAAATVEAVPPAAATGATAGAATCSLTVVGFGADREGVKAASISCTGKTVTIAANKMLYDLWGKTPGRGVQWGTDKQCTDNRNCLLTVCGGSNAVFNSATVSALKGGGGTPSWRISVCVTDNSTVTFRRSSFTLHKEATPLGLNHGGTSVLLDRSLISGNTYTPTSDNWSPGVIVEVATLGVLSTTIARNAGSGVSGVITAEATAIVSIQDTEFLGNVGGWGGAMRVIGKSRAVVRSCKFQGNNATNEGGAFYASDQAKVDILPGKPGTEKTIFSVNTAKSCGGDVSGDGEAVINIDAATFTRSASETGASLCVNKNSTMVVTKCAFAGAQATKNSGGAVYAEGNSLLQMDNTVVSNCSSQKCGGGVSAWQSATVELVNITIKDTSADTGGLLCVTGTAKMSVTGSTLTGATALNSGGGVIVQEQSRMKMVDSTVSGCSTPMGGGGVSVHNTAQLTLINSTVSNNFAGKRGTTDTSAQIHGGGVAVWGGASIVLESSRLIGNYAQYAGGGLYLEDGSTTTLQGNTPTLVRNNTARTTGGGIRLGTKVTEEDLSRFFKAEGNQAPNAPDISIAATSIEVVQSNAQDLIASDNRDGFLQAVLNVSGANGMPSRDDLAYSLYDTNNTNLFGQTVRTQGTELKEVAISLKRPPGTYYMVFTDAFWSQCGCAKANLTVTIVKCPKGYVTGGRDDTCNPCPEGLFSFNPEDARCSVCGANTDCRGGANVFPMSGFWHSAPQSVRMHRCFNQRACLGGDSVAAAANGTGSNHTAMRRLLSTAAEDYKTAQCAGPYQGNLCGECKKGFGRFRPFYCRKCMPTAVIIMLYVIAAIAMIGLVKLLVYFSTTADAGTRTDLKTPTAAEVLRALVIHAQWLYILSMMVGVPWPASLLVPLQVLGGIWSSTSGSSIGFDCILRASRGVPVAVQKLLICLFTPVGILCGVLMIEAAVHYIRPTGRARYTVSHADSHFASVVMCIVFMFLPTWVNTVLSLFTCVPLDDPVEAPFQAEALGSWWVEDMSQLCYSGYHRGWALGLGIPLTLLFCVALPAGVFAFMWYSRKRGRLHDPHFQKHYGFVYRLWRDEWCWFEAAVMVQTCVLVMISTLGWSLGGYYQCLMAATTLAVVGMLLLAVKPYKCPTAGRIAVLSVCVLFFTAQMALSFIPSYNNTTPGPVYGNIMGAMILLANLAFLLGTAWTLFRVVDWSYVKKGMQVSACCRDKANMGPATKTGGPSSGVPESVA